MAALRTATLGRATAITGLSFVAVLWFARRGPLKPILASAAMTSAVASSVDPQTGGGFWARGTGDNFAGCGWSALPSTSGAVAQASAQALPETPTKPDLTIAYYNPQHDPGEVVDALHRHMTGCGRIFGETTHDGLLLPDGYHTAPAGVLGLMTLRQAGVHVGVGGAGFDEASPHDAGRLAFQRAAADAGLAVPGTLRMVLLAVTLPHEEEVLGGLHELAGDVPLVGGTAAGSVDAISRKKSSNWSILANDRVIHNGVAVTLFYADQPFGWSYGGGYRRTVTSGKVTQAAGRLILQIDHRPAADVYADWLGGGIEQARQGGQDVVTYCTQYPLCRVTSNYNQFIRVWPADDPAHPGALRTGGNVQSGETLFLSEGTWNLLLNHFASVPRHARESAPGMTPAAGLFIYCGGALECIPRDQRPQMAALVERSMQGIPWIGVFTWGEQGHIPGAGNLHSSLTSATLLFPGPHLQTASLDEN